MRTAAIVGTNWGLIHLATLRDAGLDVVALAGTSFDRTRAIAEREGVSGASTDLARLADVDLVVVATPASTHADVLRRLAVPHIVCEKPIIGIDGSPQDLPETGHRVFVNYAFAFLDSARLAADLINDSGGMAAARLECSVNLPQDFDVPQWFLEVASHPLSWLLHMSGPPHVRSRHQSATGLSLELTCSDVEIDVDFTVGGPAGIHQDIEVCARSGATIGLSGRYVPGQPWEYDPVTVDGQQRNAGESGEPDCWMQANRRSVTTMIDVFRGDLDRSAALASGLFDIRKALWLERTLTQQSVVG